MPSGRPTEGEVVDLLKFAFANPASAASQQVLAAPGSGWKYIVYGYQLVAGGGANTVTFQSAAAAITSGKGLAANGGVVVGPGVNPLFETNDNEALNILLSAATAVGVDLQYVKARV